MATIIQPYNGWRENLAINLISPLITNMIQRSQEANQNRKLNALRSVVQSALSGQEQNLLSNPSMPENYNNNGWEQALHKTISPLTQYDLGTSGISPIATPTPTVQEHRNEVMKQLGTKRFGMLNPALVEQYFAPMYQNMEQTRQEELKKQAIDAIMNAQNDTARRNAIYNGIIGGYIPESILTSENDMYKYNNISPLQKAGFDMQDKQRTENARQFDAGLAQRNAEFWGNNYLERERMRQNQNQFDATMGYNRENADRNYALEHEKLDRDTEYKNHVLRQAEQSQINERTKLIVDNLSKSYDFWIEEANNATSNQGRAYAIQQAQNVQNQINSVLTFNQQNQNSLSQNAGQNLSQSEGKSNYKDIGSWLFDGANKGRITGRYGEDRKDHKHGGIDIPMPAGSNISLKQNFGNNFTVVEKNRNPAVQGKGYGNYIIIEGEKDGKPVRYLMAHMQSASPLKVGQKINSGEILGQVGSTGKSTGNHLHLEVHTVQNGKWIKTDPEKFFSQDINSVNNQPNENNIPGISVLSQEPQTQDNSKIIWTHTDGQKISENAYQELLRKAILNGISQKQMDDELERAGYQRAKRELTPEQDMRPSYMKGNINLPSYISPITIK